MFNTLNQYLASHPAVGIISSFSASFLSLLKSQDIIPDGIQEIVAFAATLVGLGIGVITLLLKLKELRAKYK